MIILIVILIFAAALAAAEWKWGVLSAVYDAKKLPHRLLALLPMVAMLFTAPVFLKYFADARDDVEYPLKGSILILRWTAAFLSLKIHTIIRRADSPEATTFGIALCMTESTIPTSALPPSSRSIIRIGS